MNISPSAKDVDATNTDYAYRNFTILEIDITLLDGSHCNLVNQFIKEILAKIDSLGIDNPKQITEDQKEEFKNFYVQKWHDLQKNFDDSRESTYLFFQLRQINRMFNFG